MKTPKIDEVVRHADAMGWQETWSCGQPFMKALATELRALKAERDQYQRETESLRVQVADALNPPAPKRRLREYKGVTYREGMWWIAKASHSSVSSLIHCNSHYGFTDADHAALLDLKAHPDEPAPVETLEGIIEPALDRSYVAGQGKSGGTWIGTEQLAKDVADSIRAHLAPQPVTLSAERYEVLNGWYNVFPSGVCYRYALKADAETHAYSDLAHTAVRLAVVSDDAKPLSAEDHVKALCALGAEQIPRPVMVFDQFATPQHRQNVRVLILPTPERAE